MCSATDCGVRSRLGNTPVSLCKPKWACALGIFGWSIIDLGEVDNTCPLIIGGVCYKHMQYLVFRFQEQQGNTHTHSPTSGTYHIRSIRRRGYYLLHRVILCGLYLRAAFIEICKGKGTKFYNILTFFAEILVEACSANSTA